MRILCTGDGTFTGENLIIGKYYDALEVDTPTEAQNRAFHALLQEYWASNIDSYNAKNFDQFRDFIKRDLGVGFERYKYVEETTEGLKWGTVKAASDIPENVALDASGKPLVAGVLKSWKKYTKKERKETIDRLINTMLRCGINSKKFDEILEGMRSEVYTETTAQ